MPELPDITVYLEALDREIVGRVLERIRLADVFVLRTAIPPIDSLEGAARRCTSAQANPLCARTILAASMCSHAHGRSSRPP